MPTPLPGRDCLDCNPEEMALAERLGLRVASALCPACSLAHPCWSLSGSRRTTSRGLERYNDKVQLHPIQIAFDVLHHWNRMSLVDRCRRFA